MGIGQQGREPFDHIRRQQQQPNIFVTQAMQASRLH